jgi:hypothetical protein
MFGCSLIAGCAASGSTFGGPAPFSGTPAPSAPASGGVSPGASASPVARTAPSASSSPVPPVVPTPIAPTPQPSGTVTYTPVNVAGPALDVPAAALAASLYCPSSIANATQPVILLVPGTDTIPSVDYDWNYELAFTGNHMPWCAVTLPNSATGDIQTAGEYIVNAVRTIYATSGRKLHVLGWSQGGMVPRWALRFWPDTRTMIDDLVSLDASNHGTIDSELSNSQAPADWQQAADAHFIAALNSYTETFAGINYTQIFSYDDEIVVPNSPVDSSSSLTVGPGKIANIAVQQICPDDASDHLAMGTYDAVGYALAMDAFAKGVAAAADIPLTVCAEIYQPAVVPAQFPSNYAMFLQYTTSDENHAPSTSAEPTAAPYVYTQ